MDRWVPPGLPESASKNHPTPCEFLRFKCRQERFIMAYENRGLAAGGAFYVTAELVAHRREHFFREGVLLARTETRVERRRENLARHCFFDCGHNCPAAFAGILDITGVIRERRVLDQRHSGEIEQPRTDHAAAAPDFGDVRAVER